MKPLTKTSLVAGALALAMAVPAQAKTLTVITSLGAVPGPRAYVAIYVTDPKGKVYDTIHVAGREAKYHQHLRGWVRGARKSRTKPHSVTGASAGSGKVLKAQFEIADNLIAAGYQVRVDTAVENFADVPKAAVLTLGKDTSVRGRGIVRKVEVH